MLYKKRIKKMAYKKVQKRHKYKKKLYKKRHRPYAIGAVLQKHAKTKKNRNGIPDLHTYIARKIGHKIISIFIEKIPDILENPRTF